MNITTATATLASPVPYVEAETREAWLNAFVDAARPHFEAAGSPIPLNVRVSIGFTSTGHKGSSIGECWSNEASDDNHYEIFISPTNQTDSRIADILTHELCHAALGMAAGHGKAFKALATGLGLEGKMTATTAGEGWYSWAAPILEHLGPMPYAAIKDGMTPPRKKKKTYLLKVECDACGWLARVTASHCHDGMACPLPDCDGGLIVDAPAETEE
jgi:hypothetical protein